MVLGNKKIGLCSEIVDFGLLKVKIEIGMVRYE